MMQVSAWFPLPGGIVEGQCPVPYPHCRYQYVVSSSEITLLLALPRSLACAS